MEEIMSMIFDGINMVKNLESSLSLQDSLESLSSSLGSISTLFENANERLKISLARRNALVPNQPEPEPEPEPNPMFGLDQKMMQIEQGLMQDDWLKHAMMQTMESTDSSSGRKRKKKEEEETVLVAAAMMEIPSDDNYTWRKYGQKEILGSRFPRAYYRCNHQKLYKCPAKKQVQRLDEDPNTFRVTYRGSHTCHSFATATTANVRHDSFVVNMTNTMFDNMDSVVPYDETYFNQWSLVPGGDCDEDTWNSPRNGTS